MKKVFLLLLFCPFLCAAIDINHNITSNSVNRTFILHAPGSAVAEDLPVVFILHGDGGTGAGIKSYSGFDAVSNANNFIAIYPDALNTLGNGIWNKPVNGNLNDGPNDVLFVSDMIDMLCNTYHINRNKVYATGHSGGAYMSYHLSINLADKIAAIAPVAGNMYGDNAYINAHLAAPLFINIPILHIHGDNDGIVAYIDGDFMPTAWGEYPLSSFGWPDCGVNTYISANITQVVPGVNKIPFCSDGPGVKEISLIQIVGGDHDWPAVPGWSASEYIWNFFNKYALAIDETCQLIAGQPSLLHVDGKYLKDDCDQEIVLKGVNLGSIYDAVDKGIGETGQISLTGANSVRIVLSRQYCTFPPPNYTCVTHTTTAAYIQPMIEACLANDMIPVVELHDFTSSSNPSVDLIDAANWWTSPDMLQMLLDHQNYLIINLANEPSNSNYPPSTTEQNTYYNANVAAINILRNAGYTCPIMIDGMHHGKDHLFFLNRGANLLAADPLHNLMFSVHTYWPAGGIYVQVSDAQMTSNINAMATSNLPFVMGEMAHSEIQGMTQVPINYSLLMDLLGEKDFGYMVWWWGLTGSTNNVLTMTTNGMYNSWKPEGQVMAITHENSIQQTSVRSYKMVNGDCNIFMPINNLKFECKNNDGFNELIWSATLSDVKYIEIEIAKNGIHFNKIAQVNAINNLNTEFKYPDDVKRSGITYYRLKFIKKDNSIFYSKIISISNNSIPTINFWPNPVNDRLNIHGNYELIAIRNIEGKIIAILTNTETLDVSDWAAGFYFMEVKISGKNEYYKISKM